MTKPRKLSVCLPRFPGFYESDLSQAVDREEESFLEYRTEENGETGPDYESVWPEPLRLPAPDLGDLLFRHTDYSVAYDRLARDWVSAFDYHAGEALGLTVPDKRRFYSWAADDWVSEPWQRPTIGATFEEMTSPRDYNFSTDRVFALVPLKILRDLFKRSAADNHETLAAVIRKRFTSRDGFASFYKTDLDEWTRKPLRDWDHNELGTLILAALIQAGAVIDSDDYWSGFFSEVRESTIENEGAYNAWESAVDWAKFDAARAEARAEKLAEWLDSDATEARAWIGGAPAEFLATFPEGDLSAVLGTAARCPLTLDMFADLGADRPEARA